MDISTLKEGFKGDIYRQKFWRAVYSTDASAYQFTPQVVVCPKDKDDVARAVKWARQEKMPITCRAAGTSLAGASVGPGMLMDVAKYFNQILEIHEAGDNSWVKVQPGVIYDKLSEALKAKNLTLPPTPASSRACMLGGNVATKASGTGAVKYGTIDSFVQAIEFVDDRGNLVNTENESGLSGIKDKIEKLKSLQQEILADQPAIKTLKECSKLQTASGYNLFAFTDYQDIGQLMTHLMVGSVGTLGIFTEIKLRVAPLKPATPVSGAFYLADLDKFDDTVQRLKDLNCSALEFVDKLSLQLAQANFPQIKIPQEAELLILFQFDEKIEESLQALKEALPSLGVIGQMLIETQDKATMDLLWSVRKALLPLTAKFSDKTKPLVSVDDVGVTTKDLPNLLRDLRQIFQDLKMDVALYGHAGTGTIHIDPVIEATSKKDIPKIKEMADRVYEAVFKYHGTIATEHGAGRCRSMYLEKEWGAQLFNYMKRVKEIFDPNDLLNPEVMFNTANKQITDDMKFPLKFLDKTEWVCMDCQYCQSSCPAWLKHSGESGPRHFKNLVRYGCLEIKAGDPELPQIQEEMQKCIQCGACTAVCSKIVSAQIKELNEKWLKGELKPK